MPEEATETEKPKTLGCPACGGRNAKSRGIVGIRGTWPDEVLVTKRECLNPACRATYELWCTVSTMELEPSVPASS